MNQSFSTQQCQIDYNQLAKQYSLINYTNFQSLSSFCQMSTGPQSLIVTLNKAYTFQTKTILSCHYALVQKGLIDMKIDHFWTSTISLLKLTKEKKNQLPLVQKILLGIAQQIKNDEKLQNLEEKQARIQKEWVQQQLHLQISTSFIRFLNNSTIESCQQEIQSFWANFLAQLKQKNLLTILGSKLQQFQCILHQRYYKQKPQSIQHKPLQPRVNGILKLSIIQDLLQDYFKRLQNQYLNSVYKINSCFPFSLFWINFSSIISDDLLNILNILGTNKRIFKTIINQNQNELDSLQFYETLRDKNRNFQQQPQILWLHSEKQKQCWKTILDTITLSFEKLLKKSRDYQQGYLQTGLANFITDLETFKFEMLIKIRQVFKQHQMQNKLIIQNQKLLLLVNSQKGSFHYIQNMEQFEQKTKNKNIQCRFYQRKNRFEQQRIIQREKIQQIKQQPNHQIYEIEQNQINKADKIQQFRENINQIDQQQRRNDNQGEERPMENQGQIAIALDNVTLSSIQNQIQIHLLLYS